MSNALVIDAHPAMRHAVCNMLREVSAFESVHLASNGSEGLIALRSHKVELVLIDPQLGDLPADLVLDELATNHTDTRVLVLSAQCKAAEHALMAGAHGFIDKGDGLERLPDAVRAVMGGYATFPLTSLPSIRRVASSPSDPVSLLSRRELTVLRLLATGHSNKSISTMLGISNKTVSSHKTSIMAKLGVDSLIKLSDFVRRHQLAG